MAMRILIVGFMAAAVGCGSSGSKSKSDNEAPQVADAKPPLAEQAAAFVAAPASKSAGSVDWQTSTMAIALVGVRTASDVTDNPYAFEMEDDPVGSLIKRLGKIDYAKQAAEAKEEFQSEWNGDKNCQAKATEGDSFTAPSDAALRRLPERLQKAAAVLKTGKSFDVECEQHKAVVLMNDAGKVLAFEPPREKSDDMNLDDLLEENRFVGYMNEPDEVPEER